LNPLSCVLHSWGMTSNPGVKCIGWSSPNRNSSVVPRLSLCISCKASWRIFCIWARVTVWWSTLRSYHTCSSFNLSLTSFSWGWRGR
jgi:hypothetical protein